MKLERHVGGLSIERKGKYLAARGWTERGGKWSCERFDSTPFPLNKAVHHQLTEDLSRSLASSGWKVVGYSPRGYVKLLDTKSESAETCSLPKALRIQSKREKRRVGEMTYSMFLAVLLEAGAE